MKNGNEMASDVLPLRSWDSYLASHVASTTTPSFAELGPELDRIAGRLAGILTAGGRILVAGNGGSASDANHIVGELVAAFAYERPALDVISLCSNSTILTAWSNDFDVDTVFSRQVEAHLRPSDALILLSTSGESANIVQAAMSGIRQGGYVLGLTGGQASSLSQLCTDVIQAPSTFTPTVQECHVVVYHYLCAAIERAYVQSSGGELAARYGPS